MQLERSSKGTLKNQLVPSLFARKTRPQFHNDEISPEQKLIRHRNKYCAATAQIDFNYGQKRFSNFKLTITAVIGCLMANYSLVAQKMSCTFLRRGWILTLLELFIAIN